jgi:hypothetical protein
LTGTELKALRSRSGLGPARFGAAIGYGGKSHTIARAVRRMEGLADEEIPYDAAERAQRFERGLAHLEWKWKRERDAS